MGDLDEFADISTITGNSLNICDEKQSLHVSFFEQHTKYNKK